MKSPSSESEWEELVRRARADAGPAVNVPALLAAVRSTEAEPRAGWLMDFAGFFNARRVLPTCLTAACALAIVATWQVSDFSKTLPWAEWVVSDAGGAP
jgi:hypothetical protein